MCQSTTKPIRKINVLIWRLIRVRKNSFNVVVTQARYGLAWMNEMDRVNQGSGSGDGGKMTDLGDIQEIESTGVECGEWKN